MLVLILEPLAIGLTIAANSAWMNYKKLGFQKKFPPKSMDLPVGLQKLQKNYNLSIDKIAEITNRKKIKNVFLYDIF